MTTNLKYIVTGLVLMITIVVVVIIYRMFYQFNPKDVSQYANDASSKYKNPTAAYGVIMDGVEHILSSHNLTQQVLRVARETGIDKEQELVSVAVQQCKAFGYLQ